ncbi:MAG: DUF3422 domain-containing protein [Rhodobiaceae bacterium]|nr:DUF3422 domain-containing protein [Rhodobiaceae bacterium]
MAESDATDATDARSGGIRLFATGDPIATHPLRLRVAREIHARPFEPLSTPCRIHKVAYLTSQEASDADVERLRAFCRAHDVAEPDPDRRHHSVRIGSTRLRWERHSEFITYQWQTEEQAVPPFSRSVFADTPPSDMPPPPGPAIAAVHLALVSKADAPAVDVLFQRASLCVSEVAGGAATIATDFEQDAHGFTRILIADDGLGPDQAGALAQRLLEIEVYRTLAFLGLPEAQRVGPEITRIEAELAALIGARQEDTIAANREALERLLALASGTETVAVTAAYRFNATRAYAGIVEARVETIEEEPVAGYSMLGPFLARRMNPALMTCEVTDKRLADLSVKLTRAANLLRTRVNIAMEQQNGALLASMNRRTQLQLRLQHTVEGLSVAAVSYYVVGLIATMAKGAKDAGWHLPLPPGAIAALAVPVVALGVWSLVRRIRSHHSD